MSTPFVDKISIPYEYYGNSAPVVLLHLDGTGNLVSEMQVGDSSFSGNDALSYNANALGLDYQNGKASQALRFDGVDDYLQSNGSFYSRSMPNFSMEAWINTESASGTILALGNDASGGKGATVLGLSGGKAVAKFQKDNSAIGFGLATSV
ncbi:hypothetical protein HGA64_01800, partial [Candidatus Falkowbacteria bacterium]|nr:hypothetical protein [Candidatus Falkowbacteria bacterium]